MSAINPSDILLRVTGKLRYGVLTRRLAPIARGGEQLQETFARADASTCASYIGIDGKLYTAAANKPRIQWSDLNADGIFETPGLLLEGSRTNIVTDSINLGAWTVAGTLARTSGQTDPFGGTAAYLLDSNGPSAADAIFLALAFTGDGTKNASCFLRAGTATQSAISIFDNTAAVQRHRVLVNWSGGVPTLAENGEGTGTKYAVVALTGGWYRLSINADSVVAANANRWYIHPDFTGGGGTVYATGVQAENAVFPSSYVKAATGAVTRAADSLTLPVPFGVQDLTVYASVARPVWADAVGALGISPGIFALGTTGNHLQQYGQAAARSWETDIVDGATNPGSGAAIAAGASLNVCVQFANLRTGGTSRMDGGSGFGSPSAAAAAVPAFGNQTLRVGGGVGELYGVLLDLLVVQGLHTLAECQAVP